MRAFYKMAILVSLFLVGQYGVRANITHLPVVDPYMTPAENEEEIQCSAMVELLDRYRVATTENNYIIGTYLGQMATALGRWQESLSAYEGIEQDFQKGQFINVGVTAKNSGLSFENLYLGADFISNFFFDILEVLPECLSSASRPQLLDSDQKLLEQLEEYRADASDIETTVAMFVEEKTSYIEALAFQLNSVEGGRYNFQLGHFDALLKAQNEYREAAQLVQTSTGSVERRLVTLFEQLKMRLKKMDEKLNHAH